MLWFLNGQMTTATTTLFSIHIQIAVNWLCDCPRPVVLCLIFRLFNCTSVCSWLSTCVTLALSLFHIYTQRHHYHLMYLLHSCFQRIPHHISSCNRPKDRCTSHHFYMDHWRIHQHLKWMIKLSRLCLWGSKPIQILLLAPFHVLWDWTGFDCTVHYFNWWSDFGHLEINNFHLWYPLVPR